MERNVLKKRLKGLLVFMLVFMMMFGSSLTVLAKEWDGSELSVGSIVNGGDTIQVYASGSVSVENTYLGSDTVTVPEGKWKVTEHDGDDSCWFINLSAFSQGNNRQDENSSVVPSDSNSTYNHTHDYKWEISLMPTEERDGWCDYRCECGSVTARQPISMFYVIIRNIIEKIEEAPVNGTVTVNNKYLRCLTDEIVEALLARPDVTLDVKFIDKEVPLHFTIPAGMAPVDGEDWYGYYYLGTVYGWIWE